MAMSGLRHRQCERLVAGGLVAGVGRVLKTSEFLPLTLGVQLPPRLLLAMPVLQLVC